MILLPVTVLAVVGLFSLRQDQQAAEQAARKEAAENVTSLARAMSVIAGDQLSEYQLVQGLWMTELRMATMGSAVKNNPYDGMTNLPDPDTKVAQWEKAYPGLHLDALAAPMATISDEGTPIVPADCPLVPVPPKWFLDFSPAQRQAWRALRQCQSTEHAPDALARVWQDFLGANPSEEARLAASNYERLNGPDGNQEYYNGFTETGLPFADLARLQALNRVGGGVWSMPLLDKLGQQVLIAPSFLTSSLLDWAEEHRPSDPFMREKLRRIQRIWNADSVARHRLAAFRDHPELLSSNLWVKAPEGDAVAIPLAGIVTSKGVACHCINIYFFPLPVVEAIFARALADNRFLVPDYVTPVISVEGEPLAISGLDRLPDEKLRLAGSTQECGKSPLPRAMAFGVSFYLTDREKMLSAEQRRTRLFGALIGGAVLAALAGLLAARRAFYEQHRLSEMKSNFVSSVSHELRAPIASMRLLSESLERGKVSEAGKKQDYYRFLVQESRRLTSLIENVLDFSRIEQGRKEYQREPADLDAIVEDTIKLMQPGAAEKQVGLARRPFVGPGPLVTCDGLAMQQALINLIDNAIKHSPPGAKVEVGLEDGAPNGVRLWVEDQGPGIPPEEHEKIFERFYRRGSELRRETQGIGIGLTIVKHIVEAHGGRVLVRSAVGQGSRFTIELPVNAEPSIN
jgi:signal transduction histidine kinase